MANRETGEAQPAAVFVAVLGASNYTFAEATAGQDLRSWIARGIEWTAQPSLNRRRLPT